MKPPCAICGKPAVAFRLEADGGKTFLCADHISTDSTPQEDENPDEGD